MDMSVGDRLLRHLNANAQSDLSSSRLPTASLQEVAASLTTVMSRCESLGIFTAEEVRDLLSKTVSFNRAQLIEHKGMVNTISCLYKGWDIHLGEARDFIQTLFQVDDQLAKDIHAKILEGVLTVDMDIQAHLLTGELTQAEYDRIKDMPVASDRLKALLEKSSRK